MTTNNWSPDDYEEFESGLYWRIRSANNGLPKKGDPLFGDQHAEHCIGINSVGHALAALCVKLLKKGVLSIDEINEMIPGGE